MKTLLAVLVVALVFAGSAAASSEAPSLEPAASFVAGKPVKVFCSQEHVAEGAEGWAIPGQDAIYVDNDVCSALLSRLARTYDATPYQFADALHALAHEAEHASGLVNESATDCAAMKVMPGLASRFFHFRTWRSRHDLMYIAWQVHLGLPPDYQTLC